MNQYVTGTQVGIDATFKDPDGNLVDPTTVKVTIMLPDGTEVVLTAEVVRLSLGKYTLSYVPWQNGVYFYRFSGSGAVIAAGEGSFESSSVIPCP